MKKSIFITICWVLFLVPSIIVCALLVPSNSDGTMPWYGVIILIGIPSVISFLLAKKKYPKESVVEEFKNATRKEKPAKKGKLKHIGGLPLPENALCKVVYSEKSMVFTANGQDISIDASSLIDVSVLTNKQMQQQYVSSIGGAIAGAVLLGPLGAIIGGSASKKSIKTTHKYLVLTYKPSDEVKYFIFDADKNTITVKNIVSAYKYLKKKENVKVAL